MSWDSSRPEPFEQVTWQLIGDCDNAHFDPTLLQAAPFTVRVTPDFGNTNGIEQNTITWLFGTVLAAPTSNVAKAYLDTQITANHYN
jgi:hypothetical protein